MTAGVETSTGTVPGSIRPRVGRRVLSVVGPAFVAAVAYVDPGNFATNVEGGTRFGFLLLWVVLAANVVAMLLQYLSAKLGTATSRNLPELCRDLYPRPIVWGLWLQAEMVVIMTDLAELIGGAVAVNLIFGLPALQGGVLIAAASFALLAVRTAGQRRFEAVITAMLAVVTGAFFYQILQTDVPAADLAAGLVPRFDGSASLLLAAGIVGATVMPHAIYLHSGLTQERIAAGHGLSRRALLRAQRLDVVLAMGAAGLANVAMLVAAATMLYGSGAEPTLQGAHAQFATSAGPFVAMLFAVALLASGLASSSVGIYAGQVVMQGFLRRRIPLYVRRSFAVVPALAVLSLGVEPSRALVISQVTLSFGIPFALIPLLLLTRRPDVMGKWVNRSLTTALAGTATLVIVALNALLIVLAF
ncbi:Nramp family divalent metal transporter [Streptomyces carpinensis]|uniref:Nramp family divalent metal transporter n=1 Tax=Streptomyces carpinensis TaxID=66369 RepID=A0ABV1VWL3_9ACTN|nr:Nramp family divalent metal transporter [Streptomyces carpinensis]